MSADAEALIKALREEGYSTRALLRKLIVEVRRTRHAIETAHRLEDRELVESVTDERLQRERSE